MGRTGSLLWRCLKGRLFLRLGGIFSRLGIVTIVRRIVRVFSTVLARGLFVMVGGTSIRRVFSLIDLQEY